MASMKQIVQHQKTGDILVEEMPTPQCLPGGILVRVACSAISAGTEKTSVSNAKSTLLERARKQPDQVRLVLDFIKKEGIASTFRRVQNKLDSFKTLGYSLSGTVIESLTDEFSVGDRVACGGAGYAVHSEIITVPRNLAAKLPESVEFADAAYCTIASIAMQGVRQADVRLGESVAVIGLGLIGQITIQLLKASGCRVVGMDINSSLFDISRASGADEVFLSSADEVKRIRAASGGSGFDAVLLTAGTSSNEPVEIALQIARKRGKVVVVGAVGMNLPRSPFYEKEIDFKISCSYGPGRYDPNYEELGSDYPAAFVRWTENRNMQSVLQLLSERKLNFKLLTTHRFDMEKAADAYDIITGKVQEKHLGVLLEYPERPQANAPKAPVACAKSGKVAISFIGAGAFAQSMLLPPIKASGADLVTVTTSTPSNAASIAKRYGFSEASTDSFAAIASPDSNLAFCATRHDSHAQYVMKAIESAKPIFVEKPLCTSVEQLLDIEKALAKRPSPIMVGFNRRFSRSFVAIDEFFSGRTEPMMIKYRVNAGFIPKTHWLYQPGQGDGRIVGEACHFIDCMVFLAKSMPVRVFAESISSNNPDTFNKDNAAITIKFADGSLGVLEYVANGDSALPKEYCEVSSGQSSAVMSNFQSVELYRAGKLKKVNFDGRKGIDEEVAAVIEAVRSGRQMPIPYEQIRAVTLSTFAALESMATGLPVEL